MSLHAGDKEICEITYVDDTGVEVQICEVAIGPNNVFGCGGPPTVNGVSREYPGGIYQYTLQDFTTGFSDPDGENYSRVTLTSLPYVGEVKYNGVAVAENFEFDIVNVGLLTYQFPDGYTVRDGGYLVGEQLFRLAQDTLLFKISDNSLNYSNTSYVSLIPVSNNEAPTVSNNSANLTSTTFSFTNGSFVLNFVDPEGEGFKNVRILSLPNIGSLQLLGNTVVPETVFLNSSSSGLKFILPSNFSIESGIIYEYGKNLTEIVSDYKVQGFNLTSQAGGVMTFTDESGNTVTEQGESKGSTITFNFQTSDASVDVLYSNVATFTLNATGDVNIQPPYVNNPPTVGSNRLKTEYDEALVFTRADFVEDTDPRFQDPEGDQPYKLRVDSLPAYGQLLLRGVPVVIEQEISFADDIEQEAFRYAPDSTRTDIENVRFNFSVSDTGTKQYAS